VKRAAKAHGKDSTAHADALEQLAHLSDDREDPRATELYAEVVEIRERVAPRSEDLAFAYNNLALHHANAGRAALALDLAKRAVAVATDALGNVHDTTAECVDTLARAHFAAQDHAAADDAFERAIGIRATLFGADAERTLETVEQARDDLGDDLAKLPRLAARAARLPTD
jgi:hypothetical protein